MVKPQKATRRKRVVFYFSSPRFEDYPFDSEDYKDAYRLLASMLEEAGASSFIARGNETYEGNGVFSRGWIYEAGKFHEHASRLEADVIFNKGNFHRQGAEIVVNEEKLDTLCKDKFATYLLFPKLSPHTAIVESKEVLAATLSTYPGTRFVAKPRDKEGGEGVIIGDKETIINKVHNFPYLVQEFIDTSKGIPGITKGVHDLRLFTVEGRIIAAFLRTPKPGSFIANISKGGSIAEVPLARIPEEAHTIFREVDAVLREFRNRVYAIDLGRNERGEWKIIELNSQPGLARSDYESGEGGRNVFLEITQLLLRA